MPTLLTRMPRLREWSKTCPLFQRYLSGREVLNQFHNWQSQQNHHDGTASVRRWGKHQGCGLPAGLSNSLQRHGDFAQAIERVHQVQISWWFYVVVTLLQAVQGHALMLQRQFERNPHSHSEDPVTNTNPGHEQDARTPCLCLCR